MDKLLFLFLPGLLLMLWPLVVAAHDVWMTRGNSLIFGSRISEWLFYHAWAGFTSIIVGGVLNIVLIITTSLGD